MNYEKLKYSVRFILLILFFMKNSLVHAKQAQTLPDALVCMDAARKTEQDYKIPPYILSAVALTETGKTTYYTKGVQKGKLRTPWPWTANIAGKGRYFRSKQEAITEISDALSRGIRSIDVGCMQINLRYHGEAFANLEEAFDPYLNMRYAAEFLTSLYARFGNWPQSVERYHSATPVHYQRYRKIVAQNWDVAEKLMRPQNGEISKYLLSYDTIVTASVAIPSVVLEHEIDPMTTFRQNRMRDIAKMRAMVREYTQAN